MSAHWIGMACAVCGRRVFERDGFSAHARLNRVWCWGHEMTAVNEALGEDVSLHTVFWHAPESLGGAS